MGIRETKETVQQLVNIYESLKNGASVLAELEAIDSHSEELKTQYDARLVQRDEMTAELEKLTIGLADVKGQAADIISEAKADAEAQAEKILDDAKADAESVVSVAQQQADKLEKDAEAASAALTDLKAQTADVQAELDGLNKNLTDAKAEAKRLLGG